MVHKCNSTRRGIPRGFQHGKILKKIGLKKQPAPAWISALERRMEGLVIIAYGLVMRTCIKLNVVPFKTTAEGLYAIKSKNQMLVYNLYRLFWGIIMLYRTGITIKVISKGEMSAITLLTIFESLSYFCACIIVVYDASDTAVLLNNFNMILSYLQGQRGRDFRMFSDITLSFKVLSTIILMGLCSICLTMVNGMLFGGLPTSWLWLAEGWIDTRKMDQIWWQLLFLPLEFITTAPLWLTACPVCISTLTTLHISKVLGEEIRGMEVVNFTSREKVERMYICWELHEKVARPWLIIHLSSIIIGVASSATIFIFVAIKYAHLPIFLCSVVAAMGPGLLFLLVVALHDAVLASQLSRSVLYDQLSSFRAPGFRDLQPRTRRVLMKRVKAMRPITFPVGYFAEIQYSVMVAIWEEILNQLFFFLIM